MAVALEWITSQGLAASASDPGRLWAVCDEAMGAVESGLLRRQSGSGGGAAAVEGLLAWVLEAGQDKAVPLARVAAFRLLAGGVVAECRASILASASFERLCQLLWSGTSAAASAPCRELACQAAAALVERGFGGRGREVGGGEAEVELRQKVQDALPRLLTALLGCAGAEEADVGVKTAALRALAACQRAGGTLLKPHGAKIETVAYAALAASEGEAPALRAAACACLARIPSTLADPAAWTAMLLALVGDAARTLKHVWPDCPALNVDAVCAPPSPHRPALGALPHEPEKKGAGVKGYAIVARRRLAGALSAAAALLEEGYHHPQQGGASGNSPVVLPTPQLLALCDALLAAAPKGASPLGATPSALPPTALHALQPLLRRHGLALLEAYLPAARTSCVRHLPRVARCLLRALSYPASHGLRPQGYRLLALLVRVTPGGAALKGLVEPALPLLTHHAAALVRPAAPASLAAALASASMPGGGGGGSSKRATAKKKRAAASAAAGGLGASSSVTSDVGNEMGGPTTEADIVPPGVAVLEALEAVLLSSGSLLSPDGRTSIDRVVAGGLAELNRGVPRDGATQPSLAWVRRSSPLRAAFLNLAIRALLVPRPDGTASALTPLAARVFGALVLDGDAGVARAALLGRAVAETIIHPRAAPVCIPAVLLRLDDDEEEGGGRGLGQQRQRQQRRQGEQQEAEAVVDAEMDLGEEPFVPVPASSAQPPQAAAAADVWATGGVAAAAAGQGGSKRKAPQPQPPSVVEKPATAGSGGAVAAAKKPRVEAVAAEEEEEEEEEPLPDIVDDDGPDDESEED